MKTSTLWFAAALLAAPLPLAAQQPQTAPPREMRGPVELLLRQRGPLGLSPAQVTRLEGVQAELQRENRPLVERLLEIRTRARREVDKPLRDASPEERARVRDEVERAHPLLREIRANNREAMRGVAQILTPEQKTRVRERLRERRGERRDRPARRRARRDG